MEVCLASFSKEIDPTLSTNVPIDEGFEEQGLFQIV